MTIHVVQPGDTVALIAQQYGVSPQRILTDNGIARTQTLVVGQALLILFPETAYTVRPGDTLGTIAEQFGTTVSVLLQNNPSLIFSRTVYPGQTIVIRFKDPKRREIPVNAYAYPDIQRDVLRRALPYLTYLTIFGYGFTAQGELIPADDAELINLAYEYQTAPVMLLSSITEEGNFSGERASLLFRDLQLQNKVLGNVVEVMLEKGYVGLDIDFEYINADDREPFTRFVQNAADRMHQYGFFVNVDLAPKNSSAQAGLLYEGHDYAALGAAADTVLLMTYEWGYTYGPPMAVAPIDKVREVVAYAVTEIPNEKIMLGIPNYGYDWILPFERGVTRATAIGNQYAVEIAARNNAEIQFDQTSQSPYFTYSRNGLNHVVWFEDVRSIQAKLELLEEFLLRGAGYWNAMRPFAQNWALLAALYDIRKVV